MTTKLFRTTAALGAVIALVACSSGAVDDAASGTAAQALFDCNATSQRLACADPADPTKRFICHATGAGSAFVKISVARTSTAHVAGVAHGNGRADQSPGASADDVGAAPGLDCECNARICQSACTGAAAGTACDDGDKCTGDGSCSGDTCQAGAPSCSAGVPVDACNVQSGACNSGTGECLLAPTPAGTACGAGKTCDGNGACVAPPPPTVFINEIESSGGTPGDWIEIVNAGTTAADLSGWKLLDSDNTHTPYVFAAGTTLAGGGHVVVEEAALGFGLGGADSARLFDAAGTLVDSFSWTSHAVTTYGRCPSGTGAFTTTSAVTKGSANDCAPRITINEIESSGGVPGDWVELYNAGVVTVDVSGWTFKDSDDAHAYVIPAGTTIVAGAYLVLDEATFLFGLGSADSARLFDAQGALVDSHAWTSHAATTYGRCPNGSGVFTTTTSVTKGAANDCAGGSSSAKPWPGANAVATADGNAVFGGNLSDLFYEPGVLWAVRNGPSTLFRLVWNGTTWAPDAANGWSSGKQLRYPNGTGSPDAEGTTMAELGSSAMYVATERDNDVSGVSRLSVLRFDTATAGSELVATHEWNLNADLPIVGANIGLEAITWIPDTFLVANGFFDERAGRTYAPADYPNHGTGLFFVGLEANGILYAYALDHASGGFARVATIATGDTASKALYFDRDTGYLWAACGAGCGNEIGVLRIDAKASSPTLGRFRPIGRFARPTSMANLSNEGIAIAPESECSGGFKAFFWADDAETDGHALRTDTIPCGAFIP
jgi:hypothetical protein